MKNPIFTIAALTALLLCAAAASETTPRTVDAHIDNFSFAPMPLTVAVGTTVTWTNRDDIPHTVVEAASPPGFKSPALDTGDHFTYVFAKAGTFHYFCSLHPFMHGTVVVK